MVMQVNPEELKLTIEKCYAKKVPLFIAGAFGIGKSQIVKNTAIDIAKRKGKEFREWNRISKSEKEEIFKNPEKYFVLIDERLSEYDSSDIKGLPDFKESRDTIEWKIPFWAKFITLEKSDGLLFFDEINLATQLVIASVYKIILDRIINDSRLSDNWVVVGAGNRDEDRAYTHTLPAPVRDRWSEVELSNSSIGVWTDWASQNGIDSRIIGFLNFKSSNLYKVDFDDGQKFTTLRGWERVSNLIKDEESMDVIELLSKTAIGEGVATEFISFCKIRDKLKLEEFVKNPSKIKEIGEGRDSLSLKYFLISAVADMYKDKKADFEKVFDISKAFDEAKNDEFVTLLWRLCDKYSQGRFSKDFLSSKKVDANSSFIQKYWQYLI